MLPPNRPSNSASHASATGARLEPQPGFTRHASRICARNPQHRTHCAKRPTFGSRGMAEYGWKGCTVIKIMGSSPRATTTEKTWSKPSCRVRPQTFFQRSRDRSAPRGSILKDDSGGSSIATCRPRIPTAPFLSGAFQPMIPTANIPSGTRRSLPVTAAS